MYRLIKPDQFKSKPQGGFYRNQGSLYFFQCKVTQLYKRNKNTYKVVSIVAFWVGILKGFSCFDWQVTATFLAPIGSFFLLVFKKSEVLWYFAPVCMHACGRINKKSCAHLCRVLQNKHTIIICTNMQTQWWPLGFVPSCCLGYLLLRILIQTFLENDVCLNLFHTDVGSD